VHSGMPGRREATVRDRVVAVTGGARGIGLAIATALAGAGAQVAIGDFDSELAAERADAIGAVGLGLDVRDDESYSAFLDEIASRLGPLSVLVNNAGVAIAGSFLATSPGEHELQISVNLGGVERGLRLALPAMLERGSGHVVNIASAAGRIPSPGAAVYAATKHGVVALTDAVRSEVRGSGVHLTSILPTAVHTEMAAGLRLRWLPRVSPEAVAAAVLRVVSRRKPPASVMVPRWLRVAAIVDAASPQWLRDLVRRSATVELDIDRTARAAYEERIARQIDPDP
jgi:NADP-dependent 3-hydroxy acid dehydrogenase YdfG